MPLSVTLFGLSLRACHPSVKRDNRARGHKRNRRCAKVDHPLIQREPQAINRSSGERFDRGDDIAYAPRPKTARDHLDHHRNEGFEGRIRRAIGLVGLWWWRLQCLCHVDPLPGAAWPRLVVASPARTLRIRKNLTVSHTRTMVRAVCVFYHHDDTSWRRHTTTRYCG